MNILAVSADVQSLLTQIRLAQPLGELCAAKRWTLHLSDFHRCRQRELQGADVVVVQRPHTRHQCALLQRAHAGPAALICEIDDLLTEMPAHLLHHGALRAGAVWVRRALALADAVSVSTETLGRTLSADAPVWRVVPNQAQPCVGPLLQRDPAAPGCVLLAASDRLWPGALAGGPARPAAAAHAGPAHRRCRAGRRRPGSGRIAG